MEDKGTLYDISQVEMDEILEIVRQVHGFDMSGYSTPSLRRRIIRLLINKRYEHVLQLKNALVNQKIGLEEFINELTVNVTELFRDPQFFKALSKDVIPYLETFARFKIWHAGCSTGEEMYSVAILLEEAGISKRGIQFGTDINSEVLKTASKGIYPVGYVQEYTRNYRAAGGKSNLSEYYTSRYNHIKFKKSLADNMVFSVHNLVHDKVFNEFQLIICRNVLIYFTPELQERILGLFVQSLAPGGYLVIGNKESMVTSKWAKYFEVVHREERIFKKKVIHG